jgi:Icc-related predicted phosphoesterase
MKILALSDIHENLSCIRKLRGQEENLYDAIVVAGDIGNDISSEFFIQLSTFECPVFYVYGNWDNQLEYHPQHPINCRLLHMEILEANGYFFAGYSGCPTHWGNNPIAAELHSETKAKHRAILEQLEEANHRAELRVLEFNSEYEFAVATIKRSADGRGIKTKLRSLEAKMNREKRACKIVCVNANFR